MGYIFPFYADVAEPAGAIIKPARQVMIPEEKKSTSRGSKSKRHASRAQPGVLAAIPAWSRQALISSVSIAVLLVTLGYNFITNPRGLKSGSELLWSSFTRLPNRDFALSYGVLAMILTTLVFLAVVFASEASINGGTAWWKEFVVTLGVSFGIVLIYWMWHSGALAAMARISATNLDEVLAQVGRYEGLLGRFYLVVFFLILIGAAILAADTGGKIERPTTWGLAAAGVIGVLVFGLVSYTNLRVIQADIVFKLAEPFSRSGQWPVAIAIYNRSNELAPKEDYYYLFLGRAYLEYAKTLTDTTERDNLIRQAEGDLRKAQSLNPLNTDHTANLARLYSLWASYDPTTEGREQKGLKSSEYFSRAVVLSPNSARLWDEWALLSLNTLQKPGEVLSRLTRALEIDPEYHWTYALIGEYHLSQYRTATNEQTKIDTLQLAAENYSKALALPTPGEPNAPYNYALALGGIYAQLGESLQAVDAYKQAIQLAPVGSEVWRIEEAVANLYVQVGDRNNAMISIQNALSHAPESERERLLGIQAQLGGGLP